MPVQEDPAALIRLTDPRYADDKGEPIASGDPVDISANLFDQDGDMPNTAGLSNMFVAWGQFLDHDLSLTLESEGETITADGLVAPLHRSDYVGGIDGPRTPTNAITWQIDGSQIYGSTETRTADLRAFEGGHLRMSDDPNSDMGLMPDADPDSIMAGNQTNGKTVFLAGDVRANENPALSSVHTLMAREHNYWADRLAAEHPDWDDEQLFQGARQIVEYELQKITYDEWLPHLIGDAVGADTGYAPDVDGQVSVAFSTAAFRFGHTMVSSTLPRMDDAGAEIDGGDMAIMDAFFNPDAIREDGIDAILRGQSASYAQDFDTKVVDDLNFFLSTPDGLSGFSLVALNILRGQDHGLQSYVETRATLLGDIDPETIAPDDFSIITSDVDAQVALAAVYGSVHDVDLWVGGLSEDAIDGTQVGPLFTMIISDQFTRTRAGDETFGKLDPELGEAIIQDVQNSTFKDVILRNTEIDMLQDDPFLAEPRILDPLDQVSGTTGDDTIDLAACDIAQDVATGNGDDRVSLRGGTKIAGELHLGNGDDVLDMTSGAISGDLRAGNGDDTVDISGASSVGVLRAGNGDDTISVTGSATVDTLRAGNGDDHISIGPRAEVTRVKGGDGHDTLKITGGRYRVEWADDDPDSGAGKVIYLNDDGTETGTETLFSNIETIACFTSGTRIITAKGTRRIDDLKVGDAVYTLDNGLQPLLWIGKTTVLAEGANAPIQFSAQTLGNIRATEVSPQHRMLLSDWRCDLVCGTGEVLAPARHLCNDATIKRRTGGTVTYIHLLFADHQIIFGDGIPSESFHPGQHTLNGMAAETHDEILRLFPELAADIDTFGPSARPTAKRHEVTIINTLA